MNYVGKITGGFLFAKGSQVAWTNIIKGQIHALYLHNYAAADIWDVLIVWFKTCAFQCQTLSDKSSVCALRITKIW